MTRINGCETWTMLGDTERRLRAFENKCMRRLLRISNTDFVQSTVTKPLGYQESPTWAIKLISFVHETQHDSLLKTIFQGTSQVGWTSMSSCLYEVKHLLGRNFVHKRWLWSKYTTLSCLLTWANCSQKSDLGTRRKKKRVWFVA